MFNQNISSIIDSSRSSEPLNLAIVFGLSQADLIFNALKNSSFTFIVIVVCSPSDQYKITCDYEIPSNIRLIFDLKSVYMILNRVQVVVTTVAHFSPTLSAEVYKFFKTVNSCFIPIVEVPHGLYQWGYGFVDDSRIINAASYTHGMGVKVDSFADIQIDWFGDDGVGYPRFQADVIEAYRKNSYPEYTLITTNLNWFMYSYKDSRVLFDQIFDYARSHPDELFIWKYHPAERNKAVNTLETIKQYSPGNLFLYGLDHEFYFHGIDTAEKLIANSKKAISTVSTCLADYQIHQIPVALYSCNGLEPIIKTCSQITTFSSVVPLNESSFGLINTGKVNPFVPSKFDHLLTNAINFKPNGTHITTSSILNALSKPR